MITLALTFTFGPGIIPAIISLILLFIMFRPMSREDTAGYFGGGLTALFRLFWLIPILLTWTIFFGIMYWIK